MTTTLHINDDALGNTKLHVDHDGGGYSAIVAADGDVLLQKRHGRTGSLIRTMNLPAEVAQALVPALMAIVETREEPTPEPELTVDEDGAPDAPDDVPAPAPKPRARRAPAAK